MTPGVGFDNIQLTGLVGFLPVVGIPSFPTLPHLAPLELSWCQMRAGNYSNCNGNEIKMIL